MDQRNKRIIKSFFYSFLIVLTICTKLTHATHVLGGDLLYTHISGNTYQVKLTIYGDCSGFAFQHLVNSSPEILLYDNFSLVSSYSLNLTGPGVNVTPVCPQQASNTQCDNPASTIPGVMRYIYSANITVPSQSANYRFRFEGKMPTPTIQHEAGRSNQITNIPVTTGGSLMTLEAKLNNLNFPNNSSPQYTSVPTPFFCINQPSSFNPGAVDQNGDSLVFSLIPALTPTGTVTYLNPYTGANPVSGTNVSFNSTNGQFSFTPDITQISVVANEIKEYRNGILVGSSMREMNFVVQNNCNNVAPNGGISAPTGGTAVNNNFFRTCPGSSGISFQILPTDANGDTINVTYSGIPAGAVATITGNNTPNPVFNFNWNLASATPGTFYTIYLTYTDNGCPLSAKQTIAYTIYVLFDPAFNLTIIDPPTCIKKAVFTLTPIRNTPPYDIDILQTGTVIKSYTGVTNSVTDSLDPGLYSFEITDGFGCTHDTILSIDPPPPITVDILNLSSPICFDDSTGSFTASPLTGVAPYTYSLDGGPFTSNNNFTNLASGSYTLSVRDANDCQMDTTIIIDPTDPIQIATTFQKPPCNFFQNGSITVVGSNTTAPYTYSLDGGPFVSSGVFTGLYSGNYTVTVKDGLGCEQDFQVVLPDSIKIAATLNIDPVTCHGDTTASITVNATNGYPPYDYSLNGGATQTNNVFTPLAAGAYQIEVTDTEGCYWDTTLTLIQPDSISLTGVSVDPLCFNSSDGSITITATGGTAPYTYSINGLTPQSSNLFPGLPNGTYTITVEDDLGCTKDITFTLQSPPTIVGTITVDSSTCPGTADGSITVSATGGVPPYTYSVGAGFLPTGNFAGLSAGTYTVSIKDANNCIKDSTVIIHAPQIIPSLVIDTPTCIGDSDGSVTVSATGGTPPYTYSTSSSGPFVSSGVFGSLTSGTYTFYIKDANDCIKDTTLALPDPPEILIDTNFKKPPCNSFQNGEIEVIAKNSTGPYTYSLDGGAFQNSGVFTGLYSGTYTITVKNALGCQQDFTVVLPDSLKIEASVNLTHNPCFADSLGEIEVLASGAFPPYTYFLDANPPQTPNTFTGLPAGTYAVHVRDTQNCYWDSTVVITEPDSIQIFDSTVQLSCYQSGDGQAYFTVTGGTAPYTYAIDGGAYQSSNGFTGLAGGWHTIAILDANSCDNQDSFFVLEPDSLYLTYTTTNPSCFGSADGEITASGVGGTVPYTYSLNGGPSQTSGTFTGLTMGTYTVTVIDDYNCSFDTTVMLTQPDSMDITASVQNPTCSTLADGQVTLTVVAGGTGPFTYSSDGVNFSPNPTLGPLPSGTHILTVMDDNGCIKDTTITLVDSFVLSANILTSSVACSNTGSGWIQVTGTGGNPIYNYGINGSGYSPADTFKNLFAGTHVVSVKDTLGCIFDTSIILVQPTPIEVLPTITPALCYDSSSAQINVAVVGGTAPYTYSIDGSTFQTSPLFTGLAANTYTITVIDDNGCTGDTIITVAQPAPIQMLVDAPAALCHGTVSATITITASNGTAPYTYSINGSIPQSSNIIMTTSGTHIITTTDANGCAIDTTVTIVEPDPITFSIDTLSPTCRDYADGQITVQGLGGVSNYSYRINGGSYQAYGVFQNLVGGSYTVTIKDSNDCTKDTTVFLVPTNDVGISSIELSGETCYDYKDGVIDVVGYGQAPLKYSLRNYSTDQSSGYFDQLETGNYTLSIEDSLGCVLDTNLYIDIPEKFEISTETVLNNCEMSNNEAMITVTGSGGTSPYSFVWSTGQTSSSISNLENGYYSVVAKDANGCTDSASAEITFDNCCNPFVPNAFTPNHDGENDIFEFRYNGDIELKSFKIFNRWGQVVFETDDPTQGWDGTFNDKEVDVGVYFYQIIFICGNLGDNRQELSGDLTLIR